MSGVSSPRSVSIRVSIVGQNTEPQIAPPVEHECVCEFYANCLGMFEWVNEACSKKTLRMLKLSK